MLERIAAQGVTRKLVGVEIGGEPFRLWLEDFWPVRRDGRVVGKVTWPATPSGRRGTSGTAALSFLDPGKDIPKA